MDISRLRNFIDKYWILFFFILIKFVGQLIVVNPIYELQRDEFLHLDQANHLAFGFISVPPLTSLFSVIIYWLGGSLFWIRFFPALFGALTIVFAWLIVEQLQGKLFAKVLVSSALIFSVYMRLNILFQPNSFDILAWTMVYFFLINYITTEKLKWLLFVFLSGVLGFYNKYNISFLFIGLFIGILLSKHVNLFSKRFFWKAVLLSLLLLLPNLIWQITHQFPVIMHMRALSSNQLVNNSVVGFLRSQIHIVLGSLPLVVAALIAFWGYKPFKPFRIIGISFIATIIIFSYFKAKDYYALGLYPVLFAFGGVYLEKLLSGNWLKYVRPLPILLNLLLFLFIARYLFPILSPQQIVENKMMFEKIGLLRWEDGKNHPLPQDFSDMLGWKEMADKATVAYKAIPKNELDKTIIFCDNYGQCGALNYYNRAKTPESYTFNIDHIFWLPKLDTIQNIVFIGKKPDNKVLDWFTDCKYMGRVESEYSREKGTAIYLLTGSKTGFTKLFYQIVAERKKKFDIF
jgi:hypothetical protein